MTWFTLALLAALATASQDAWVKKWFSGFNPFEMFAIPLVFSLPLTLVSLTFVSVPPLDNIFFASFAASLPLNAVPFVLYMKAIRQSPLSLTVPYLAFTPVFMIGTGFFFLDELPDIWGLSGVLAVCAGSYVLNLDLSRWSLLGPFRAFFREPGSQIMLIVAFFFSFSSVIGKLAILHSSVMFFQMAFFAALGISLPAVLWAWGKIDPAAIVRYPVKSVVAGGLLYLQVLFHGFAISMTKAVYMISVKRLSILFGVIFGGVIFKEENIPVRFVGALLMFSGAVTILLRAQ